MLYVASALPPTSVISSLKIEGFKSPGTTSLVVAKPDRIEVWDVTKSGLESRADLEVWGSVVAIEKVSLEGAQPHVLVLLGPPNAQLLLVSYNTSYSRLDVTSASPLSPPTPTLRTAEFFSGVIVSDNVALVSLWIGILSCIEMEVEKDKDTKRRRSSAMPTDLAQESASGPKKLVFSDNFNLNIREHNLIHLSFLPNPGPTGPLVSFLWLTSSNILQLQLRSFSPNTHAFTDATSAIDVLDPHGGSDINETTDFAKVALSCPAARRVLPVPALLTGGRTLLLMGDEFSVLYALSHAPSGGRRRMSIQSATTSSPRANATRRSPQNDMVAPGKRRKSSISSKTSEDDKWDLRPIWRIRQGFGTILAATVLQSDGHAASVLMGDEWGTLHAIGWEFERQEAVIGSPGTRHPTVEVKLMRMGCTSPPSSLTHLSGSHVFLSSTCGDSAVLQLSMPPASGARPRSSSTSTRTTPRAIPRNGKGRAPDEESQGRFTVELEDGEGRLDTLERWMNLAPIKDFDAVKEDGGGISHLVVSSGASRTNSLRVVRSGVGLVETLTVDGLDGVERMWKMPGHSTLLLSTGTSTHLLQTSPEVVLLPLCNQIESRATLAAAKIPDVELFATVSAQGLEIWQDMGNGERAGTYAVAGDREVVAASISGNHVVMGLKGGELVVLEIRGAAVEHKVSHAVQSEISAVSIYQSAPSSPAIIAVSTWSSNLLVSSVAALENGQPLSALTEEAFASSLLLKSSNSTAALPSSQTASIGERLQLLAGLSDGSLITYEFAPSSDGDIIHLISRKASSLGTQPLKICPVEDWSRGEERVVAVGLTERMSVIFETRDRIDFSSVSRKDVRCAAGLKTPEGDTLTLATPTGLTIAKVSSLKKLHVQTLDLGKTSVVRMAVLPDMRSVAVGHVTRDIDMQTGDLIQEGSFALRDAVSLDVLAELSLRPREEVSCIAPVNLLGDNYIAVGTAIFGSDAEFEEATMNNDFRVTAKEGRVLLVKVETETATGNIQLQEIAIIKTIGPVHDIKTIHGFLAVASASKVAIHRFSKSLSTLGEVSSFGSAFIAQHLYVTPPSAHSAEDRLVVGDGMRSVFVLEVDAGSGSVFADQRDMATHSVVAMAGVQDQGEGMIVADGHSNLLTLRLRDKIENAASFGLHEDIVRFRPGSLAPPSAAADVIRPNLLFATNDGRLGMIGELTAGAATVMDDLQRNMDKYTRGPGGTHWKDWRTGGSTVIKRATAGFIDGDFVEKYIDQDKFSAIDYDRILNGGTAPEHITTLDREGQKVPADRSDVRRVLEAAAGMH